MISPVELDRSSSRPIDLILLIYEFTDDNKHHEDNSNTVTYWHLFTFTLASYNNLLAITLVTL